MKSALLFTAMLSGLCAEVMASPFGSFNYQPPAAPLIERDLQFNADSVDEAFTDDYQQELVTTDFDPSIDDDPIDDHQASGPLGVPEPPPVMLVLSGLISLGFFALGRRAGRKRHRTRRRTGARIRAITAEP
jgi:hypothetical protein